MTINKILLDPFEIHGLRDGFFHLDGGAMFGVVPKTLWEKKFPADSQNRIKLGLNSILIKHPSVLILVETGIGSLLDPKYNEYYSVERKPGLLSSLESLGVKAEDIDFVINTHLHFDHCGGNTYVDKQGEVVPTFPNAKYVIQKGEWDYALNPNVRDKPSYLLDSFFPLEILGCLQLVDGDTEIIKGVKVILTPGHTSSQQCVKVQSGEKVLFFLGDMIPTSAHVGLPYIMSYDLFPLETLQNKQKFLDQAIEENWIVAFNHDPLYFFGKISKRDGKYIFQTLQD